MAKTRQLVKCLYNVSFITLPIGVVYTKGSNIIKSLKPAMIELPDGLVAKESALCQGLGYGPAENEPLTPDSECAGGRD